MKSYPDNLLSVWQGDSSRESLPTNERISTLFSDFCEHANQTFDWIENTLLTLGSEDDEELFDQLYSRVHVLTGFSGILQVPKVFHLLSVLDFALDYARWIETLSDNSLDYLVKTVVDSARAILADLRSRGQSSQDLTDTIEECDMYLAEPLKKWAAELEKRAEPSPAPTSTQDELPQVEADTQAAAPTPSSTVSIDLDRIDDGPEPLHIPADKVGIVSDFCEESRDNLNTIGQQLVALEDESDPIPLVNDLFRSVHTIKGGSRLLRIGKIETLTHHLETLLNEIRSNERKVTPETIDVLLDGKSLLDEMVEEVASNRPVATQIKPVLAALLAVRSGVKPKRLPTSFAVPAQEAADTPTDDQKAAPAAKAKTPPVENIRVATTKLDDVLNNASEVFITRIRLQSDLESMAGTIQQCEQTLTRLGEYDVQMILNRLSEANRKALNSLSPIVRRKGELTMERLGTTIRRFHDDLEEELQHQGMTASEEVMLTVQAIEKDRKNLLKSVEQLDQLSNRLQSSAMGFRMVPISQLFDRFPTQVRDMARQVGKRVKLDVSGADTELDRVLINQLGDPLLHMLRNSVDHGVEQPEQRVASGKKESGFIKLSARYHGSHVIIEVSDDGRGIDLERVADKAMEMGLITTERLNAMSRDEVLELVYTPGLSTVKDVTKLSGRGVGMDVVRTVISRLQGSVSIDKTDLGGTTISMKLPLTLAVVGIVLVEEAGCQFALPIMNVEEILIIDQNDIREVSRNTLYNYRGKTLPVTTLSSILDFEPSLFPDGKAQLVVLSDGEKRRGIIVDAVPGRQDVLIKNLGNLVKRVPYVMGCTILSDSRLVLILNALEIVNMKEQQPLLAGAVGDSPKRAKRREERILAVDDSSIQRRNLRSILTQAGYAVDLAENGFDALKCLERKTYSAFCVDVVMPLMDGFEFVERLRAMPAYRDKPVVLITGREGIVEMGRADQLGVRVFLKKPIDKEELIDIMDDYCLEFEEPYPTVEQEDE